MAVTGETGDGHSRWRTFGERTIYDNPWVWLGQVDVELPDGERFWHHVVRLHRAAMIVLLDGENRVLLLWRHRFVQDRWGWELPGGLIDDDEEPADTAARELRSPSTSHNSTGNAASSARTMRTTGCCSAGRTDARRTPTPSPGVSANSSSRPGSRRSGCTTSATATPPRPVTRRSTGKRSARESATRTWPSR